ncbi:uncharacterized protein OsI_027940-like [Rosa rugosa]|uniref:uncharacterized protein OsI_027940-like n=1 Tax=Rosa rugosa TaxID=74645 RepID=UPI002B4185D7|nr:uncharacterized protein OsI_027940-like [Rosa rugosa]
MSSDSLMTMMMPPRRQQHQTQALPSPSPVSSTVPESGTNFEALNSSANTTPTISQSDYCICCSRHPEVKWAQREDKVFLTVLLPVAKDAKVKLEPEGVFIFSASAGAGNNHYELKLDLFDKVDVEESKISIGVRSIVCIVEKAEKVWWSKLLKGDGKTPHYVKVDWDKWVDEDEDPSAAAIEDHHPKLSLS